MSGFADQLHPVLRERVPGCADTRTPSLRSVGQAQRWMTTIRSSVISSMAQAGPSLVLPESRRPP